MVKMSVDFPNEAARCQRFLSRRAQSSFARAGKDGPADIRRQTHFRHHWGSNDANRSIIGLIWSGTSSMAKCPLASVCADDAEEQT